MNRIRYAYREMVPGVEPYFISSFHDDIASVLSGYSVDAAGGSRSDILHGLTTSPVMVGVVSSVVAGALASVVLLGLGFGLEVSLLGGVVGFGVTFGLGFWLGFRRAVRFGRARTPEFPAPTGDDDAVPGS
jgi:membrane protein DedA with SNARE-associated domain